MNLTTTDLWTAFDPSTREALQEDPIPLLFIEDDPAVAEMYRIKLELDGYRVSIVDAGDLDAELSTPLHPELVFLDIRVPHRERVALLRRLRENPITRDLPIVILSDYSEDELAEAGRSPRTKRDFLVLNFSGKATLSATPEAVTRMQIASQ